MSASQSYESVNRKVKDACGIELWALIIILIVVLLIIGGGAYCYTNEKFRNYIVDAFKGTGKNNLKNLEVLFFMRQDCPWCQKMIKVLENEGVVNDVTVVDVATPEGKEIAKKLGVLEKGVPVFISAKNQTGSIGYKDTVKEVIEELTNTNTNTQASNSGPSSPEGPNDAIQSLGIVMFKTERCGHCKKMKELLGPYLQYIELHDMEDPDVGQVAEQYGVAEMLQRGVPLFVSKTTGKSTLGSKPLEVLVSELK